MTRQFREMVLVTGASSGIGAVYADRLARRGFDPILVARSEEKLHELADRLFNETSARPEVFPADLGDPEDLSAVERRLATDERITTLVNNAGVAGIDSFAGVDPRRLEAMIDINVMAVTRLAAAAAGQMIRRGNGTIINISSVTALMPESFEPVYSATKAFVLALSQSMARQLEPHGIRVQAVLPGITRTAIWESRATGWTTFRPTWSWKSVTWSMPRWRDWTSAKRSPSRPSRMPPSGWPSRR